MMEDARRWFAVRMIFKIAVEGENAPKHFEDRIVVVRAHTEDEARGKAGALPTSAKDEYLNVYGQKVAWTLKEILDVVQLLDDELGDGSEVYYAFINEPQLECLRLPLDS